MALSDEKVLILKMLEEGKISSEEAVKLMEAMDNNPKKEGGFEAAPKSSKQANFQDEIFKMRDKIHEWKKDFKNNYKQNDFDRTVEEFAAKAEKLGKNVATTTVGIVDRVIDFVGSFVETNAFNLFGSYKIIDKAFDAIAIEGAALHIEGINGSILVKKHIEDKIKIRTKVRSPQNNADEILMFEDLGGTVSLKIKPMANISVSHEVYLPAIKFGRIKLETTNGKIYVEDSLSQSFECTTRNSHIELMGVNSEKISVGTKNARIQIGYVIGRDIDINTNNSVIDIKHIKTGNLKAVTMNGRILVENVQNYEDSKDINLELKTSNGGIKVNMDDMNNHRGYKVKAQTSNGGVNLLIPQIKYDNLNKQMGGKNYIEAESEDFNNAASKVYIDAQTVNGYIEVVK
ncbi:MAG: DUF4097 domain-containing protein [Clostridia bacterium]|nr:DUF4097 domain-containing protein [Clostridia bacterium]